ncbi:MAG: hypothetical protein A2162_04440 [Deltaproteobacteria bacterium RBG_13_52_11b]|nr:MAG: hypothetical protein A2162_04440 [Deltaproteobacteria bacterium RBG_13_52_11b]
MSFFNSLSTRIALSVVGGILYSLLIYAIVTLLNLPSELSFVVAIVLFLLYVGSRFLILFSGIDSGYYSRSGRKVSNHPYKNTYFFQTTQWVGRFYHYHDIALFIVLMVICFLFLGSLLVDWLEGELIGNSFLHLVISLVP